MIPDIDFEKQPNNVTSAARRPSINNNWFARTKIIEEEELNNKINEDTERTPIQKFYSGQTIFVTGGTGFLGKVLLEKLLRCCPDITRIYVLLRTKKEKNSDERLKDLLNDSVFENIKSSIPKLKNKLFGIPGDCSLPGLGLSTSDIELLTDEVSIVFHAAATIRFNEKLKQAVAINVQSTASVLDLCKNMKNLKSFMYVSTAYSNCFNSTIEEKFYDYSMKYEEVFNLAKNTSDDILDTITPHLLGSWPNTYTFTKAMTEDLIRTKNKNLPMGIFRPGIVISSAQEPVPGWTDNFNGPTGAIAGAASGILRTMHGNADVIVNLIPVDYTVNALIASAWDVAIQKNRRDEDMLIYNFTSTVDSPISWGEYGYSSMKHFHNYPTNTTLWYFYLQITKSKILYLLSVLFLHLIPAFVLDGLAQISGQKPKLQKMYERIYKMADLFSFFGLREWDFRKDNVQNLWTELDPRDKQMFHFTMQNFDWQQYIVNYVKGIRTFLFKEDMSTLEKSRQRYRRKYWMHQILQTILMLVGCWVIWSVYALII